MTHSSSPHPDNSPSPVRSQAVSNVLKSQPSAARSNGLGSPQSQEESDWGCHFGGWNGYGESRPRLWRRILPHLQASIEVVAGSALGGVIAGGEDNLMASASMSSKAVFCAPPQFAQAPRVDSQTRSSVTFRKPAALSCGEVLGLGVSGSLSHKNELRSARAAASAKQAPRLRLEVTARTAGAAKQFETEVDKPLGLALGQNPGGRVVITQVDSRGNAAKAGLKVGDQVIYTSSFFGDELWPADKLGFTKTAINAKPDSVYFVVARGADVDVKRLPKRPAPPRFGKKLTEAQKARATHVCLDCGYIYTLAKPFDEQPEGFQCPQCQAPKKRFAGYDPETGNTIGGQKTPLPVIVGVVLGAAAIGAFLFFGLQ